MNSLEMRKKFFDFFMSRGHTYVSSSSLIPAQDPTLLFANAGMNQFKDIFLGKEHRLYKRAVSIQKCIRAGGKHNDLENVGFTKRHLTFFEMMGNFSFGDYFKQDAIKFAWDFLTQEIGLDSQKLYATVYYLDDEAYYIWHHEIGLPKERIGKLGAQDNFWQMSDTGPCGPCSEIYIDRGLAFGCGYEACAPGCSCDRFLEIWNLVFIQFDRQRDGTDILLKQFGVDTGMGLERLCVAVQNKDSVFDTDIFAPLLKRIEELTGIIYNSASTAIQAAFRVLVDHIRSSCFAIADGCIPSNEGRGYVVRKIIRRAALFAQKLDGNSLFPDIAPTLISFMGDIYPELQTHAQLINAVLKSEVEKFASNLVHGQQILQKYFQQSKNTKVITGQQAFKLYDTYGFPLELSKLIAHEHGFSIDTQDFEAHMENQRKLSGKKEEKIECDIDISLYTHFTGYDEHITKSNIIGLIVNNMAVEKVPADTTCVVITEHSPFYVECGGQISDQGFIAIGNHKAKILSLQKLNNAVGANIKTPVALAIGDTVTLIVDTPMRINTMKNHTATHLLQAALMVFLGKSIKQAGSVVTPDYLRFDFTYHENLTTEQIKLIEDLVNKKIMENIPVRTQETTLKDAASKGVIAFFGEKYNPDRVRVVEVPGFSTELCGGTHVQATGDIGCFKIIEVSAPSTGNRRLTAVTGPSALVLFQENFNIIKALSHEFKVPINRVLESVNKQKEQLKIAHHEIKELKKQIYKIQLPHWIARVEHFKDVPFLYLSLDFIAAQELKDIAHDLLKIRPGLYVLVAQDKVQSNFFVALSTEYVSHISLREFAKWLRAKGLQGGGKDTSIQGGGLPIDLDLEYEIKQWFHDNIK